MDMRLFELFEAKYSNWTFPSKQTMAADFAEYKKKEASKWELRASTIGARFPLFKDAQAFEQALKGAKVITVSDNMDSKINNRSHTASLDELKSLVSGYVRPRDVDRIVDGFKNNDAIPYPIILKGSRGMWIMAGNTRLDTAGIMGVPKKALLVDVSGQVNENDYSITPMGDAHSHRYTDEATIKIAKKLTSFIKKNCKPRLKATNNGQMVVYRGFEKGEHNLPAFAKAVRKDRKPLHSSKTLHRLFMGLISVAGKTANRENSVAVSGDRSVTSLFGYRYIVLPIGDFKYTWHVDFGDWSEDFVQTYADSTNPNQTDLGEFYMKLPSTFTKEWFDENFEFLLNGIRGDDGTLQQAIGEGRELMIATDNIIAVDVDLYKNFVRPLLQDPSYFKTAEPR